MKVAFYSSKNYEIESFNKANTEHTLIFIPEELSEQTISKSQGCDAVCCFVTDNLNSHHIQLLANNHVKLIARRSAGFDHVDLAAAKAAGITVVRVPKYSPEAIAEFALGLILILNRKMIKAYTQGLKQNFSLEGLIGSNIEGKTIGIIGTGNIGTAFARIMQGFNCNLLAVDPFPNDACLKLGVQYVTLEKLFKHLMLSVFIAY
jgi:D-lactate dehydrogenase